ncbi:MAG: hypothetical protein KC493_11945 [Bacteriovoracaceae bacterium]|nr:hypothetical protein [Bacteriovoracaceae bacterium]
MKTQQNTDTLKDENIVTLKVRRGVRLPEQLASKRFSLKPSKSLVRMKSVRPLAVAKKFSGTNESE